MSAEILHTLRVKHGKDIHEVQAAPVVLLRNSYDHPSLTEPSALPPLNRPDPSSSIKSSPNPTYKVSSSKLKSQATPAHMRKVHAGRKLSPTSTFADFPLCTTLLALGPRDEVPDGCHPRDIEILMAQLGVDRNTAIRALRSNGFDLVDAMLHLG
ncbi:hypothetical protein SpCBS45565_g04815 [Spizellomyces sp. 'palustris']|nr:hypothetical protein SpCBS45565_g04815 [Spizellomyces sp. 'palustris']